jgi:electron transport complex protein RnfB
MTSVKDIDALLPQTQCKECGFPGCLPYAEALAQGTATINKCPPGGVETVKALGELLKIDSTPYLNEAIDNTRAPSVARIIEEDCIGCTKCIKACPVDAIIGSAKLMHSVIAHECTGCGLCVEPCPVDCIEMVALPSTHYDKDLARQRYKEKQIRLLRDEHEQQQLYREKSKLVDNAQDKEAKQQYILQALERAKAKRKP